MDGRKEGRKKERKKEQVEELAKMTERLMYKYNAENRFSQTQIRNRRKKNKKKQEREKKIVSLYFLDQVSRFCLRDTRNLFCVGRLH